MRIYLPINRWINPLLRIYKEIKNMDKLDDSQQEVTVEKKLIALVFSVLAFIWVGFVFVFGQLILFPDMSFSEMV